MVVASNDIDEAFLGSTVTNVLDFVAMGCQRYQRHQLHTRRTHSRGSVKLPATISCCVVMVAIPSRGKTLSQRFWLRAQSAFARLIVAINWQGIPRQDMPTHGDYPFQYTSKRCG